MKRIIGWISRGGKKKTESVRVEDIDVPVRPMGERSREIYEDLQITLSELRSKVYENVMEDTKKEFSERLRERLDKRGGKR